MQINTIEIAQTIKTMILKNLFKGFIILHTISYALSNFKYELVVQDEELIMSCNNNNTKFPDIYFDSSNLKFEILEDGYINFVGTLEITNAFPKNTILKINLDFYKKDRGSWVNSIYNFKRPDLCKAMFDPTELWYKFTSSVPIVQRKCPLYSGQQFTFNTTADMIFIFPSPRMAGEYKGHFILSAQNTNTIICADIFLNIYRV
ncbi:uncharacterized protein LOC119606765 [Lucilia sericata]|uniref:uncharacterized protein LOC119606765 n=1 Tax=Lucilia sericata TaxID=13632 RepID=UPI0018A80EBB|nr:uncharacterized protein LOC119606765 [Lucilia sericata]